MYEPTRQLIGFLSLFFFILGIFFVTIVGNKPNADDLGYEIFLVIIPLSLLVFIFQIRYFIKTYKEYKKVPWIFFVFTLFVTTMLYLVFG